MRRLQVLLMSAFLAGGPVSALAQQAPGAEPGVTRQDCQAVPPQQNGESAGAATTEQPDHGNLSATLDKCNGVLQPPQTGDTGVAAPPPDSGKTPVIPPSALPPQQPEGDAPANQPEGAKPAPA